MTTKIAPTPPKTNPTPTSSTGLTAQQKAQYARLLIGTNLAAEKRRLEAAPGLVSNQKLALVQRESNRRVALAAAKLSDGSAAAQWAKTLQGWSDADLHAQGKALRTSLTAGTAAKDAPTRLTVIERELARREGLDVAEKATPVDHSQLHGYADSLKGLDLQQLDVQRAKVAAEFAKFQHGDVIGHLPQLARDRVELAIASQAIAKAAPKDSTRMAGNTVFDGPGMFIADASAYSAAQNAAKLKAAGVTWVALQINNPGPVSGNVIALQNGWADQWRAAGFKVGFWGVSYGNAATDARTAADLTAQYHGDFYIADCEGPFQQGEGDPARNKAFVDAFQAEADIKGIGKIPRALSSMGRVALDMSPWIDGGWDAMPQTYYNDYNAYEPASDVQFWENWRSADGHGGWPKDRIHPTIATYPSHGDQKQVIQVKDYFPLLKNAGTTGFSYYLPESYLDDTELQQLASGIAGGMNGLPPAPGM